MALNQWSKRSLILVAMIFACGGFLVGTSSSQQKPPDVSMVSATETGRFQMVEVNGITTIIDTRTARFWQRIKAGDTEWRANAAPWEKQKKVEVEVGDVK